MITVIIIAIIGFGIWLYFKLTNEVTPPVEPQNKDFETTLYRQMNKLKDNK